MPALVSVGRPGALGDWLGAAMRLGIVVVRMALGFLPCVSSFPSVGRWWLGKRRGTRRGQGRGLDGAIDICVGKRLHGDCDIMWISLRQLPLVLIDRSGSLSKIAVLPIDSKVLTRAAQPNDDLPREQRGRSINPR